MINIRHYKTVWVRQPFKVEGKPMDVNLTVHKMFTNMGSDTTDLEETTIGWVWV